MANRDTEWVPPLIGGIAIGAVVALISALIFVHVNTPNPKLQVIMDPSAKGVLVAVTCSIDALGNADAQGFVSVSDKGTLKIGAEFYSPNSQLGADTGTVYTYFDTSDPNSGEGSGVLGFSVVAPESIISGGRPTACKMTVDS